MKVRRQEAPPIDTSHLVRIDFWSRVAIDHDSGCWPWQQSVGSHGYGQTWDGITVRVAHRCAWTMVYGPIEDRLTVDHICRNTRCCNPAHLRLMTNEDNARDNKQAQRGKGRRSYKETV